MKNNKLNKRLGLVAAVAALAVASVSMLAGCGEDDVTEVTEAKAKATGYSSTCTYMDYVDLGGYGSDFTIFTYYELTIYDDDTYVLNYNYLNYAGAWSIIANESDMRIYGTYTTTSEDAYGIIVNLSAATRVVGRSAITSTITYNDTDDVSTFTSSDDQTAEEACAALLASYSGWTGVEIDYETHALTMPE